MARSDLARNIQFSEQFAEQRNGIVSLDHDRYRSCQHKRSVQQRPDAGTDRSVVGVDRNPAGCMAG